MAFRSISVKIALDMIKVINGLKKQFERGSWVYEKAFFQAAG